MCAWASYQDPRGTGIEFEFFMIFLPPRVSLSRVRGLICVRNSCRDYWPIVMSYPQVFRWGQKSRGKVFSPGIPWSTCVRWLNLSFYFCFLFFALPRHFWFVSTIWGNFCLRSGNRDVPAFSTWQHRALISLHRREWGKKRESLQEWNDKARCFPDKMCVIFDAQKILFWREEWTKNSIFFDCRVHVLDRVGKLPITGFCFCHRKQFFLVISIYFRFQPRVELAWKSIVSWYWSWIMSLRTRKTELKVRDGCDCSTLKWFEARGKEDSNRHNIWNCDPIFRLVSHHTSCSVSQVCHEMR